MMSLQGNPEAIAFGIAAVRPLMTERR